MQSRLLPYQATLADSITPLPQPFSATIDALERGVRVGDYEVDSLHARGGFAAVYRATSVVTGLPVALKVLHPHLCASPKLLRRFQAEVAIVNRLDHPNIVQVRASGELSPGRPYFVMDWLDGKTLGQLLESAGRLSVAELVPLWDALCAALTVAHEAGIVHRDLKSSNVMVIRVDGRDVVKLVDFGIAKLLDPSDSASHGLTSTDVSLGTPRYMAPEQICAQPVDARTDVYALGVLLFEMLTGRFPFNAPTAVELRDLHLHAPVPRISDFATMPAAIDGIVRRCLEKQPSQRYASVAELASAFREASQPTRFARGSIPPSVSSPAIGLHVELRVDCPDDQFDDAVFDELDAMLGSCRAACTAAGLTIEIESGNALVAVARLPVSSEAERAMRETIVRAALALDRQPRAERIAMTLTVHVAPASMVGGHLAGELMQLASWTDGHPGSGVVATRSALADLESMFATVALDPEASRLAIVLR